MTKLHFLIIKNGALGDVVRTAYFAEALRRKHGSRLRLSWMTKPSALPLIRFNPHVDDIWTSYEEAQAFHFDHIFSLDDELEIVQPMMQLRTHQITGVYLDQDKHLVYTPDCATWFDMGLLSQYGKEQADRLKKENRLGHAQIFTEMFLVDDVKPALWGHPRLMAEAHAQRQGVPVMIGINPYASDRWKSKEMPSDELGKLLDHLLDGNTVLGPQDQVVLLGVGPNRHRNLKLAARIADPRLIVPETDDSVLRLAAVIATLDYLISSDSLGLHLAIAQSVPFLAFFAPTSAAEIDDFGLGCKLQSIASDYCSYRSDSDNTSITADRILELAAAHRPDIFVKTSRTPQGQKIKQSF